MAATRYPLEALLKARTWELDALKQQVRSARDAVARDEDAIGRLQDEIRQAEADLLRESRDFIRVDMRRLVVVFVKDRRARLADTREQLATKLEALEKLTGEMAQVRRSLRALERHRERYLKTLDERIEKNQEKAIEDTWLGGRRARGNG
jgi:peptidoglycan hydrolase CwlO-like protein